MAECAVIGVADEERGQIVKACVVLRSEHAGDEVMVKAPRDFVKATVAPYKYPWAVELSLAPGFDLLENQPFSSARPRVDVHVHP